MEDEEAGPELFESLEVQWNQMAEKQGDPAKFLQQNTMKKLTASAGPEFVAYFNPRLDLNRFLIEDSDGKKGPAAAGEMPKIESSAQQNGGPSTGFDDNSDPFEEALDDALCVFKSGDGNSDVLERNQKLILFNIDLENEMIVEKKADAGAVDAEEAKGGDAMPEMESEGSHPVLLNQYPICQKHSVMLMFADAGLPQVLSDELLLLVLQVFKVSDKPSLRLGYNSMGADCVANNLHFHMIYADSIFGQVLGGPKAGTDEEEEGPGNQFPIERAGKKLFFKTSLKHRNQEEINMYNVGVRFGELTEDWPLKTLILAPEIDEAEGDEAPEMEDAMAALAHTAGIVLNYFIDNNIPHNMLIAEDGMTLYIIPRKFDMLIEKVSFVTSFETLCGLIKFKTETAFNQMDGDSIKQQLAANVSLSGEDFDRMKEEIVQKFMKEYEGVLIEQQ